MCYIMTQVSEAKGEKSNDFSYLLLIFPSCISVSMRPHAENRHRSREALSKFRVLISVPVVEQYL